MLDLRKGKVGNGIFNKNKNLIEDLKLEGFTNLRKLIISSHQLISLDVSNCPSLEELDCRSNELTALNVTNCSNLKKIDCSNNPLWALDLSTCSNLEEVNINGCSNLTEDTINSSLAYDGEKGKLTKGSAKNSPQIRKATDNDIRNILIVGMTGSGKSTLANVLSNTNEFKESGSSISTTKNFQTSDIFEWKGKQYRLIDNIGFGDTNNISNEDILFKIGEGIHATKEGINQVLFVFKDRFSESQITAFNLFKNFIDETGITKFTTLVRTNFEEFEDLEKCEEDRQSLLTKTTEVTKEIINSCNNVIYVDNPPIPIIKESDNDRIREKKKDKANINKEKRKKSIKIMLDHAVENCLEIYKLKEWDSIHSKVEEYKKKKEQIEQDNSKNKEEELKQAKTEVTKEISEGIKVSVGAEVPGIGGFTAAIEHTKQVINW
ncbi:MAG: hypothetical protein MRERV_1c065 [Mycoplasmataceae bacterium RV_VA103A]|nr:MAG: hypothetical protein MRERV_1c065 [Mycoplasmataceae bacterium RV_VA103A]